MTEQARDHHRMIRGWPLFAAAIVFGAGAILLAMGRPPICTCARVDLWVGDAASAATSQMLADWYSPSHILHGLIFYALLSALGRGWSIERRFLAALLAEAAWEIAENSPTIIARYREATVALGYTGDSMVNSLSDMAMMALGFLAARRLPLPAAIALALLLELVPLIVIRDNLTLNILMLLAPSDSLRHWQQAG